MSAMLPDEITKFVDVFEELPSIGPRQATRLAFRVLSGGKDKIRELSNAVSGLEHIHVCPECFFVFTGDEKVCHLCNDASRDKDVFMIAEKETDVISIEKTRSYNGRYFIIGGLTKGGVMESWQKMRLSVLKTLIKKRCSDKKAREIILALNPTTYGDLNASLLQKELKDYARHITRLGRGIPVGGEIEFADIETLGSSILRRE